MCCLVKANALVSGNIQHRRYHRSYSIAAFMKQSSAEKYLAKCFCQYFCELLENSYSASKKRSDNFQKVHKNHPWRSLILVKLQLLPKQPPKVSQKKVFLERCLQNSQENTFVRDSILIKLQASGCKKETLVQVFSCEFCEIFKNTYFTEHLLKIASSFSFLEAATGGVL